MSETPTDRVELTNAERGPFFKMLADYKRNWITTADALAAVESIVAARVHSENQRLLAVMDREMDKLQTACSQRDASRAELAAARHQRDEQVQNHEILIAELASANARCAELEKQREALSFELQALRATPWHQRMEKAEATLDRATAALRDFRDFGIRADLNPTINAANPPDYGWWSAYLRQADERVRDRARAALTPEGKP